MSTVVFDFHCKLKGKGRIRMQRGAASEIPPGNTPRITKLMALALKFERLLSEGAIVDYADLARLGHVSRARVTQIMGLLNLAPEIQEEILFLPRTVKGRDAISAREAIKLGSIVDWKEQRRLWKDLKDSEIGSNTCSNVSLNQS